jgi:hypothetical protein
MPEAPERLRLARETELRRARQQARQQDPEKRDEYRYSHQTV